MQIRHSTHVQQPPVGLQTATPSTGDADTGEVNKGAMHGRGAAVRQLTPAHDAPGVIAKIQSGGDGTSDISLPPGLVYSLARKADASSSADTDADTQRMAEQHRQALQRNAGTSTNLAVDKDGVLVAKPGANADAKAQDFVTFAVNTMREYADEEARQSAQTAQTEATSTAPLLPRSLGDVQKLAARFKLFS